MLVSTGYAVPQYLTECSVLRGGVFDVAKNRQKFCEHAYSFYKSGIL